MDFLREAVAAVQRNLGALGLYMVVVVGAHLLLSGASTLLGVSNLTPGEIPSGPAQAYLILAPVAVALAVSAAQAVVFARIGREIDKPLWKVRDDREALRRFFRLWVVLNLLAAGAEVTLVFGMFRENESMLGLGLSFSFLLHLVLVPVGACMMFPGTVNWQEFGRNLAPLATSFPRALLLILLNFFGFLLIFQAAPVEVPWLRWVALVLIAIILAYLDCVVFAGTWILCIEHRNADDTDLDF